jgi:hypothetical protein
MQSPESRQIFLLKRLCIKFYVVTSNFRVSEYQYYEFRTIDRGLTDADMNALRSISTRAEITSTSFTNHYEWGDLKAEPLQLLEKYFDAFVYVANWGSRRFCLRFPKDLLEYKELQAMLSNESGWVQRTAKHFIIGFENRNEERDEWDDGTGWMGSLVSLRGDLLRDDLRCLYLGWLLCVQNGEVPDKQPEPPVPAGLGQLSASLGSLIDFLGIDQDLVAVAAANSAPFNVGPSRGDLDIWIRNLPENEKNVLPFRDGVITINFSQR